MSLAKVPFEQSTTGHKTVEQPKETTAPKPGGRILALDILRALAVFFVLGRHMAALPDDYQVAPVRFVFDTWIRGGWIGVDLFFVVSGFLISGLLFREYDKHGIIRYKHFLIRRGFKIYPAFYVFLLISIPLWIQTGNEISTRAIVGELTYLQNYVGGMWNHTWSLAVEEHFYLVLPPVLILFSRWKTKTGKPFGGLVWLCMTIFVVTLAARVAILWNNDFDYFHHLYPTHLRFDALMFGVMLSYFYNYHPHRFVPFFRKYRRWLFVAGFLMLVPPFFLELDESFFIQTFGLTLNYIASGIVLLAALLLNMPWNPLSRFIGWVGTHTYSIYLWHMPVVWWGVPVIERVLGITFDPIVSFLLYSTLSIILGVIMGRLVEVPVLRFREALYPSRSGGLQNATQVAD